MTAHKWQFASRFRRNAFGWRSATPIQRIKEALSEIKQVARKEPVIAAEGAVTFLEKLSPALERVDSSSGALGTAVNRAIWVRRSFRVGIGQSRRALWPAPCSMQRWKPSRARESSNRSNYTTSAGGPAFDHGQVPQQLFEQEDELRGLLLGQEVDLEVHVFPPLLELGEPLLSYQNN